MRAIKHSVTSFTVGPSTISRPSTSAEAPPRNTCRPLRQTGSLLLLSPLAAQHHEGTRHASIPPGCQPAQALTSGCPPTSSPWARCGGPAPPPTPSCCCCGVRMMNGRQRDDPCLRKGNEAPLMRRCSRMEGCSELSEICQTKHVRVFHCTVTEQSQVANTSSSVRSCRKCTNTTNSFSNTWPASLLR